MIADFADRCTHAYVIVDELYQVVAAPHDHRPGPAATSVTDLLPIPYA